MNAFETVPIAPVSWDPSSVYASKLMVCQLMAIAARVQDCACMNVELASVLTLRSTVLSKIWVTPLLST